MYDPDKEQERLRRLRSQQLQSRDPGKKQRKIQHHITNQYHRTSKDFTLSRAWNDLHHRWRGLIIGAALGILVAVLLAIATDESWGDLLGIIAILLFSVIGLMIGSSLDWRDEVRDI